MSYLFNRRFRPRPLFWLFVTIFLVVAAGIAYAATKPAFLTESTIISADGGLYEFWFTSTCSTGDPDCNCDTNFDNDSDGDGILDEDTISESCIADTDADGDGVLDTFQDVNLNGIPDLVDPDWSGGGEGTGLFESLANRLPDILDVFINDWGLRDPHLIINPPHDLTRDLWIHDLEDAGGVAHRDGSSIELNTESMLKTSRRPREILTHEVWHTTQNAYDANRAAGKWAVEGQARMVPDRTFADLDTDPDRRFLSTARDFLDDPTWVVDLDLDNDGTEETKQAVGLLGASYDAALWWAYLVEQAGNDYVGTPGEGMDFVEAVLEKAQQPPIYLTGQAAVDQTLRERIGRGFDDTFWDFTIANYAKDTDLTRLSPAALDGRDPQTVLRYRDELEGGTDLHYGTVITNSIASSDLAVGAAGLVDAAQAGVDDADGMPDYGAKYYEVPLPSPQACSLISWEALNFEGDQLMHSFLLLADDTNGDGKEEVISLERHRGATFTRGVINKAEYARFVAIVATGGEAAGYLWEARCKTPIVTIVEPTTAFPASVGNPAAPGRFLLWLEVTDGSTTDSVVGLDWQRDFAVTVGGVPATVLNGDYVQNQYWLLVQAPDIPGAQLGDSYNVRVDLVGTPASDTETNAVVYDLIPKDQVLVIDRSGSMSFQNKLGSAQAAARLYSDATQQSDQLGVVSFSDNALEESPLVLIPDQDDSAGVRAAAQADIDAIVAAGQTTIGGGLRLGQNMLNANGVAGNEPWMVLLSDGFENRQPWAIPVTAAEVAPSGTKVHAIALGVESDPDLMRAIAVITCGEIMVDHCFHALDNDGLPIAASAAMTPPNLTNEMADIYRRIGETIADHQRLWQDGGTTSGAYLINLTVEESGGREAFFSFNWEDSTNPLNVSISGPLGAVFTQLTDGMNHSTIFVPELISGNYVITLNGANEWIGSLSARIVEGTEMHAFIDTAEEDRNVLEPAQLQVSVSDDGGPVPDASVTATVYRFDGIEEAITLRDDGVAPHDDEPNDGVYGYTYDRVNGIEEHNITFDITAIGPGFTRHKRLTYRPANTTRPDANNDGLVDRWQMRYKVRGANADPDRDGLTNEDEMNLGTDPTHPDTDRGGETDGSEVDHGRNPLEATDDALEPVTDFWCESQPGMTLLRFNLYPDYDRVRVFRRTLTTKFTALGEFSPKGGELADNSVVNGVNYVYFIQALGTGNVRGAYSIRRHCQPDIDPYAPVSELYLNDDFSATNSIQVTVTIPQVYHTDGTPDITHVRLSNSPDFQNASWQPYSENSPWTITPNAETSWGYVYAQLRDAAGNVSQQTIADGIFYDPALAPLPISGQRQGELGQPAENRLYLPFVLNDK